jgi:hypothetical protein
MPIEFRCSQCGQMLRVAETSAGKSARCPGCKAVMVVPAASDLAARSLAPLSQPLQPVQANPSPPVPAALPPTAAQTQQDALFEYLKQATTPTSAQPAAAPQPAPYQQPGVLPAGGAFADSAGKNPFGEAPQPASANPYASPAGAAYPSFGAPPPSERPGLPWEVRGAGLPTWWETSQLCLGDAERAFRQMRQQGGFGSPMLYAILGLFLGFIGNSIWSVPVMALRLAGANQGNQQPGMGIVTELILNGLFVLIWATVGLFISAAVTHLCLLLVGGARYGFETTYRVTAFTAGSIAWLNIIPCFGWLIAFVMSFVCMIQGLANAHETTGGRAAAAVLLPMAFCIVLVVVGVVAVIAIIAANQ